VKQRKMIVGGRCVRSACAVRHCSRFGRLPALCGTLHGGLTVHGDSKGHQPVICRGTAMCRVVLAAVCLCPWTFRAVGGFEVGSEKSPQMTGAVPALCATPPPPAHAGQSGGEQMATVRKPKPIASGPNATNARDCVHDKIPTDSFRCRSEEPRRGCFGSLACPAPNGCGVKTAANDQGWSFSYCHHLVAPRSSWAVLSCEHADQCMRSDM
jgi:hypothetical protein